MKSFVVAAFISAAALAAGTAQAQEALAQSSGCLTCHAVATKKMGPSFKDVAAKYKGQADAEAKLVAKLKDGKGHPAVKTSEGDTMSLVKWILAM
jgi:cytochrome c